ncbi:poly(U)-specific 3'-to-5' RNA exonuclease [Coniosporium tulheliwenetii]|uniref:Poly(U)-specific 3'-to-5' RNA exonuclease n=1 Tax=Coniosporium tulheliwenetii TaxID=3383036 RepID=A0ACC2ZLI4_9PEZI|nr:poly(U)-specific 3'-to-5' RNA exonuclease [Cladosporium sp. JES 115]
MVLVDYSDSEPEEDEKETRRQDPASLADSNILNRKRKTPPEPAADLPPLPAGFQDLYSTATRASTQDDPSLHGGRKRSVPHVEGNWPTHVYLEWHPSQTESNILADLINSVNAYQTSQHSAKGAEHAVHSLLQSDLSAALPLHISLSRSLVLQTPQRDPFLNTLTSHLRSSSVRPFQVAFTSLKWVPNFERTRWFLVLGVQKPERDELNRLLKASNDAAAIVGLPPLYASGGFAAGGGLDDAFKGKIQKTPATRGRQTEQKDCSDAFHVSVAWSLKAPEEDLRDPMMQSEVAAILEKDLNKMRVSFEVVKVKIGNAVHSASLATKNDGNERGILG